MPSELPESIICSECDQPILPDFQERILESGMTICLDCRSCVTCGKIISDAELKFSLQHSLPTQHARCRQQTNPVCKIPVDSMELHQLNLCRLIIIPDCDLSVEANKRRAELAQQQLWETFSIEQKYLHTQMMESAYGACYLSLKKDPIEIKAKQELAARTKVAELRHANNLARARELPSERKKLGIQERYLKGMLAGGVTKEYAIEIWKSKGKVWMEY